MPFSAAENFSRQIQADLERWMEKRTNPDIQFCCDIDEVCDRLASAIQIKLGIMGGLEDLEEEEIVAVLAHEVGHYKLKHSTTGLILATVQSAIMFYLFSLFVGEDSFAMALGGEGASFHLGLLAFGVLYSPISMLTGLLTNALSRHNEYQADNFAKEKYEADSLVSSLKKLSKNNLSNLTPHPVYVFFHYSHPPLLQRIRSLKK